MVHHHLSDKPIYCYGGEFYFDFHPRRLRQTPMEKVLSPLAGVDNLQILEIGSCEGQSTLWFIKTLLTGKNCSIVCIDPHRPNNWYDDPDNPVKIPTDKTIYGMFQKNILDKYSHLVEYHRDRSDNILPTLKQKFDLIYIDGCHKSDHVYNDVLSSWLLLKTGGIIMIDDYHVSYSWKNQVGEGTRRAFLEIGAVSLCASCGHDEYTSAIEVLWDRAVFMGKKQ